MPELSVSTTASAPVPAAPAETSTSHPVDTALLPPLSENSQAMRKSTPGTGRLRQSLITEYLTNNAEAAQAKKTGDASGTPSVTPAVSSTHTDAVSASPDGGAPPPPSGSPSGADVRQPPPQQHPAEIKEGVPAHMASANQATEDQRKILEQQVAMQRAIANEQMTAQIAMAGITAQQTLVTSLASSIVNGAAELGKINKEGNQAALSAL